MWATLANQSNPRWGLWESLIYVANWSEAQLTTWPCNWHLKWGEWGRGGKGASEGVAPHLEELPFFPTMRGLSPPQRWSFAEQFFVSSHQSALPVCPFRTHHPDHHGATSVSHRLSWPHTCLLLSTVGFASTLSSLSSSPKSFLPLSHGSPPPSSLHSALL